MRERDCSDRHIIKFNESLIGYGALKGNKDRNVRDTIFEFYTIPTFVHIASPAFTSLLKVAKLNFIECQNNDGFKIAGFMLLGNVK